MIFPRPKDPTFSFSICPPLTLPRFLLLLHCQCAEPSVHLVRFPSYSIFLETAIRKEHLGVTPFFFVV